VVRNSINHESFYGNAADIGVRVIERVFAAAEEDEEGGDGQDDEGSSGFHGCFLDKN
jgi:hypothetical protein